MNEKRQILKDAAIKIVEDRIIEIGSKEELLTSNPKAHVVGGKNFMLIPHFSKKVLAPLFQAFFRSDTEEKW